MEPLTATLPPHTASSVNRTRAFTDLRSEDFLQLMLAQLTTQDPFEPAGNEELLRQISSIRDIELSTSLTESLHTLTGQQRMTSASALIGRYVTGVADESGAALRGIVSAVRFDAQGRPMLQLANGGVLPLDQIGAIEDPLRIAETLIGRSVTGLDLRNPLQPQSVSGLVTGVRLDERGEVLLDLDTGGDLRFRDVLSDQEGD
jgi:flagellar basal-body rod modification protein FlgD